MLPTTAPSGRAARHGAACGRSACVTAALHGRQRTQQLASVRTGARAPAAAGKSSYSDTI
eukprot:scaffold1687_cov405-Prasinococcus_capsulatus_cf.AAC.23